MICNCMRVSIKDALHLLLVCRIDHNYTSSEIIFYRSGNDIDGWQLISYLRIQLHSFACLYIDTNNNIIIR